MVGAAISRGAGTTVASAGRQAAGFAAKQLVGVDARQMFTAAGVKSLATLHRSLLTSLQPTRVYAGVIRESWPARSVDYEATSPILVVDSEQVATDGWAQHAMPLTAGQHHLRVGVPFQQTEWGRAERQVSIAEGQGTALVYRAPRLPASPGSILGADEKEKVEVSAFMVVLLVAAVIVVVVFTVAALT